MGLISGWMSRHPWLTLLGALALGILVGVVIGLVSGSISAATVTAGAVGSTGALLATARRHREEALQAQRDQHQEEDDLALQVLTEQERRVVADGEIDGLRAQVDKAAVNWATSEREPPP